jgi:hypothetical protein
MCLETKFISVSKIWDNLNDKKFIEYLSDKLKKIATKDIQVYKILVKQKMKNNQYVYSTPYYNFRYDPNFHYYQTGKKFTFWHEPNQYEYSEISKKHRLVINRGLHAYKHKLSKALKQTLHEAQDVQGMTAVIATMYIPKGSIYYENREAVVSDNLIWYGEEIAIKQK